MSKPMSRLQAKELFTLVDTVRHVKDMKTTIGAYAAQDGMEDIAGCLLCEGVRHGLYTMELAGTLDVGEGFAPHFGCTEAEAHQVIFHHYLIDIACEQGARNYSTVHDTNGENYYQAAKALITKYGFGDLFEQAPSFREIMHELKQEQCHGNQKHIGLVAQS